MPAPTRRSVIIDHRLQGGPRKVNFTIAPKSEILVRLSKNRVGSRGREEAISDKLLHRHVPGAIKSKLGIYSPGTETSRLSDLGLITCRSIGNSALEDPDRLPNNLRSLEEDPGAKQEYHVVHNRDSYPSKMGFFDNLRHWDRFRVYRYILLLCLSLSGDGCSKNQWIGPVYSLGQLVRGLKAAFFLDTMGRKPTLGIGALTMQLSTALLVWSGSFAIVIAARVIEGVSIGFLLLGYQIYAVEIAAKEDRGFVSSFLIDDWKFLRIISPDLKAGIIYGISYSTSNIGWRAALGVTFIPATILLMVLPWVPESPRYLYEKGKEEECRRVVGRLHGFHMQDGNMILSEAAQVEFEAMKAAISWDQEHGQDKWSALWNSKAARYRSFVAISSQSWWAWNGGSIFTYYYTIIFTAAGITDPHIQFGIAGAKMLPDVWGRRTNYLIGTGQACLCLLIQGGVVLGIFDKGKVNHSAGAGFVSVYIIQWFLWVTFFSPVVNMLPAEIYSAGLRARGYAIANVASMGVGFATQYSALPMYRHMHGWVWIFFAGCMAFAFSVIYLTYPETKGLTLEEVEIIFGTGAGQRVKQALGRSSPDTHTNVRYPSNDDGWDKGETNSIGKVIDERREVA
ncbi:hypothetical protein TREMEDRAFT_61644 [Tremella mesenterica DSM 1558]|uniref:uncharacterized protein n=1 Tax=Tremella mesenterica (strain ATCC 24925 / CBS 8224 / DSM 1558 / NBRC 9311 / NRRL Y-6157 / RJB 2259-6 / UBC 559-6) TaxID=578456 RepID=UPI0003F49839|nr:uncharacterized protein TREMEDRAFT_61644 [Tremella mesenterica DSM 1558]EIW69873.1 hypothetical protein TREMEDRAFT_61644 [Tremella mesenterica DSM 1558]